MKKNNFILKFPTQDFFKRAIHLIEQNDYFTVPSLLLTLLPLLRLLQARISLQWRGQLEPDRRERRAAAAPSCNSGYHHWTHYY